MDASVAMVSSTYDLELAEGPLLGPDCGASPLRGRRRFAPAFKSGCFAGFVKRAGLGLR